MNVAYIKAKHMELEEILKKTKELTELYKNALQNPTISPKAIENMRFSIEAKEYKYAYLTNELNQALKTIEKA